MHERSSLRNPPSVSERSATSASVALGLSMLLLGGSVAEGNAFMLVAPTAIWVSVVTAKRPAFRVAVPKSGGPRLRARDWRLWLAASSTLVAFVLLWNKAGRYVGQEKAAVEHLTRGELLFRSGDFEAAREVFSRTQIPPHLIKRRAQRAHNLAASLLALERLDEAEAALAEALRLDPHDYEAAEQLQAIRSDE